MHGKLKQKRVKRNHTAAATARFFGRSVCYLVLVLCAVVGAVLLLLLVFFFVAFTAAEPNDSMFNVQFSLEMRMKRAHSCWFLWPFSMSCSLWKCIEWIKCTHSLCTHKIIKKTTYIRCRSLCSRVLTIGKWVSFSCFWIWQITILFIYHIFIALEIFIDIFNDGILCLWETREI